MRPWASPRVSTRTRTPTPSSTPACCTAWERPCRCVSRDPRVPTPRRARRRVRPSDPRNPPPPLASDLPSHPIRLAGHADVHSTTRPLRPVRLHGRRSTRGIPLRRPRETGIGIGPPPDRNLGRFLARRRAGPGAEEPIPPSPRGRRRGRGRGRGRGWRHEGRSRRATRLERGFRRGLGRRGRTSTTREEMGTRRRRRRRRDRNTSREDGEPSSGIDVDVSKRVASFETETRRRRRLVRARVGGVPPRVRVRVLDRSLQSLPAPSQRADVGRSVAGHARVRRFRGRFGVVSLGGSPRRCTRRRAALGGGVRRARRIPRRRRGPRRVRRSRHRRARGDPRRIRSERAGVRLLASPAKVRVREGVRVGLGVRASRLDAQRGTRDGDVRARDGRVHSRVRVRVDGRANPRGDGCEPSRAISRVRDRGGGDGRRDDAVARRRRQGARGRGEFTSRRRASLRASARAVRRAHRSLSTRRRS